MLDIGLLTAPVDRHCVESRTIWRERLVVAVPARHGFARSTSIPLRRVSNERFIMFPRSIAPVLYDDVMQFCRRGGFSLRIVQEAAQSQTIISLCVRKYRVGHTAVIDPRIAPRRRYLPLLPRKESIHGDGDCVQKEIDLHWFTGSREFRAFGDRIPAIRHPLATEGDSRVKGTLSRLGDAITRISGYEDEPANR